MTRPFVIYDLAKLVFAKVGSNTFSGSLHRLFSFFPVSWTYFTILLHMSQSIYQTDHFVDVSTKWKVVYSFVSYHTFFVDQESSSICNRKSLIRKLSFFVVVPVTGQYTEVVGNNFCRVSYDRVSHPSDPTLIFWS